MDIEIKYVGDGKETSEIPCMVWYPGQEHTKVSVIKANDIPQLTDGKKVTIFAASSVVARPTFASSDTQIGNISVKSGVRGDTSNFISSLKQGPREKQRFWGDIVEATGAEAVVMPIPRGYAGNEIQGSRAGEAVQKLCYWMASRARDIPAIRPLLELGSNWLGTRRSRDLVNSYTNDLDKVIRILENTQADNGKSAADKDRQINIVAHSFGSVAALQSIRQRAQRGKKVYPLVVIGTPYGVGNIYKRIMRIPVFNRVSSYLARNIAPDLFTIAKSMDEEMLAWENLRRQHQTIYSDTLFISPEKDIYKGRHTLPPGAKNIVITGEGHTPHTWSEESLAQAADATRKFLLSRSISSYPAPEASEVA